MKFWELLVLIGLFLFCLCIYATYIKEWDYDAVNSLYKNPNADIIQTVNKIKTNCLMARDNNECYAMQINRWIEVNLDYRNDTWLQNKFSFDNDINHTLRNGNDCEGFAVFSATVLHELGVENIYYIDEEKDSVHHVSIGVKTENGLSIINSDGKEIIEKIRLLT